MEPKGGERSEESEGEHSESLHHDQVRVVITSLDGRVVTDNLVRLVPWDGRVRFGRASRDGVRFGCQPARVPRLRGRE